MMRPCGLESKNTTPAVLKMLIEANYQDHNCYLSRPQIEQLKPELESTIYLMTHAVIEFVKSSFEIEYTPSGMRDLPHRLGYGLTKPKLMPSSPDREAQEAFAKYYEDSIDTKLTDVEVIFIDAVHPEHNTMAAYVRSKKDRNGIYPPIVDYNASIFMPLSISKPWK